MDLVYTNDAGQEQGLTSAFAFDLAYGKNENDFELTVGTDIALPYNSYVYIDGTSFGGIVRGQKFISREKKEYNVFTGDTWHGILNHSIIRPDAGQDYFTVTGDANECIQTVITRQGLGIVFDVDSVATGVTINYRFKRYCTAYAGLVLMLKSQNLRLEITKEASSKPMLSAVHIDDHSTDGQQYTMDYSMSDYRPTNHLVCLGEGTLHERTVIDLFADSSGNISQIQTIFGKEEIVELYDYSSADDAKLLEEGTKKLKEMQATEEIIISAPEETELEIGDVVGVTDTNSGKQMEAEVVKVIVKVSENGNVSKSYELGSLSDSF